MNSVFQRVGHILKSVMNRKALTVLSIAVILIALPLTVFLNQQRQDIRQHASSGSVCVQGEFTDLSTADQQAVYCLSTDPYCIVQGTSAASGGTQFFGSRDIVRSEAVALIARYHVNVLGDWQWVTPTGTVFPDVPPGFDLGKEIETAYKYGFIKGNGGNFNPFDAWVYGMYGINRNEYFDAAGNPLHPLGNITRSLFVQQLFSYGSSHGQLPVCNPQTVTRCSNTNGCTRVTFQSVDGGVHPLPGTTTYTNDASCGPVSGGDNSACPAATATPLPAPSCTGAAPQISVVTDPNMNLVIKATGVTNAQSIKFPTWSNVNEQDDLVWYPGGDVGGGVWQTTIPLANHTHGDVNTGAFTTHVYVYNTSYPNGVMCAATSFTVQPATHSISGVVSGGNGPVTVNARTSGGVAPLTTQTSSTGVYSFTNLAAGTYSISITLPSGYSQTSATVNYSITLGTTCSIGQSGTTASCGSDGNVSKVNFTIAPVAPTPTPTIVAIAPTDTPVPPTATATPAPNHTTLSVSFRQHGIGLPSDNANPNPTIAQGSVIPTPVQPFQTRFVTVYLSTGTSMNNGTPVYEYQKTGSVTFTNGNGLYGYSGTIDLGTDIPSGQYIVAIRTSNSLSQQATGFATITAGKSLALTFPPLTSGNVYDTSIDHATPTNDNQLDILDYNAIMDNWLNPDLCAGKSGTDVQVCQAIQSRADLNADGTVDVLDYNLFIREMSTQRGR